MPGVNGGGPIWSQLPNKDPCGSPSHNSKDDVKGRALAHVHYAKTGHEGGSPQISFQYSSHYVHEPSVSNSTRVHTQEVAIPHGSKVADYHYTL
jgi:hypothetical protein